MLIKLYAVPPSAEAPLSSCPGLCALCFSRKIYFCLRMGRRPDLDGFHALLVSWAYLSLRIHLPIGPSVIATSSFFKCLITRLYRSFQSLYDGHAGVDEGPSILLPSSNAAELSEGEIFNSDSDGFSPSRQTSAPVKQMIDLISNDNNY